MKLSKSLLLATSLLALGASEAFAHRVNVFAYAEDGAVVVTGKFSTGSVARGALVTVTGEDGRAVMTGKTDDKGAVRLRLPVGFKAETLRVKLNAGEGHVGFWTLGKDDFAQAAPSEALDADERVRLALKDQEERVIAPLRKELEELRNRGPGFWEVAGGAGWIVGIFALFQLLRNRRRKSRDA